MDTWLDMALKYVVLDNGVVMVRYPDGTTARLADVYRQAFPGREFDDMTGLEVAMPPPRADAPAAPPRRKYQFGDVGSSMGNETLAAAGDTFANAGNVTRGMLPESVQAYVPPAASYLPDMALGGLLGVLGAGEKAIGYGAEAIDAGVRSAAEGLGFDWPYAPGTSARKLAGDFIGGLDAAGAAPEGRMVGAIVDAAGPAIQRGVMDVAGDFAADEFGGVGFRAFHGSPHDFDRFDMSKIGTGEGAQAYGHGLYFAENENIARSYRDALSPNRVAVDGRIVDSPVTQAAAKFSPNPDDYIKALTVARERAARNLESTTSDPELGDLMADLYRSEISDIDAKIAELRPLSGGWFHTKPDGRMYEVQINADPNDFLDWDKPFSSADDVERFAARFDAVDPALRKRIEDFGYVRQQMGQPMPDGNDIIREVMGGIGSKDAARASEAMREAGIPGIRYLDAGSRGAGDGSRNYVVFDDKLIDIVRKYGIAGAAALYGVSAMDIEAAMAGERQPQGLLGD